MHSNRGWSLTILILTVLVVVAHIAAAHGGSVAAESAPGGGALFRVRWPQDVLADPAAEAEAGTVVIRQMAKREQDTVAREAFAEKLRELL